MGKDRKLTNLEQLLDRIEKAADDDRVSLDAILDVVGRSSFGPLLLVAGLVTLAPIIGDIPGVPTIVAVFVLLTAGQLLFRREHIWLPRWLLKRSVARNKLCKALGWLRRPARFVDRLLRPRLTIFTQGAGIYAVAIGCIVIAAAMPVMELVPFSANGAGAALTAFGLSLIARDGLLALLAFLFTAATFGLAVYHLF
ncbi:exopolysaccharide biosynthesis protein [Candidatus Manganitrophus noduliformans]|uniref:Exopolysaccharide biosynthesis protein n=1 Tax=Candidatus Manganitrophus noduliformans TaxID=2606439 RepID=A0A7X6DQT8_9BACT|nr:exopolysaccharide biosynthesis protein [Candidatus Manganitrophus noduliformans]NKE71660.1 exopolysaccharide biosynthesis protein [Candidatus Manganitrophus noduliformans]